MKRLAFLTLGAGITAVASVAFAAESSPARPDLVVERSAGATKFVSKRYGYQLSLAGQWKARYARTGWTGHFPRIFDPARRSFRFTSK